MVHPMMRLRISLGLLSLGLAAAATAPSVSDAALTTIGPQTLITGTENNMSMGTFIEYSLPGPAPEYVSPIDGTIVTWRIASGSSSPVRLRVLRPVGGGKFAGVGTSAVQTTNGSPPDTFATNLPIKAGDIIGLDNETQALIFTKDVPGAFPKVFTPALADGAAAAEPKAVIGGGMGLKLEINADIQPTPKTGGGRRGWPARTSRPCWAEGRSQRAQEGSWRDVELHRLTGGDNDVHRGAEPARPQEQTCAYAPSRRANRGAGPARAW